MKENKTIKVKKVQENKSISLSKKIKRFWHDNIQNMSSIRQILMWYFIISIVGALILWAPISQTEVGKEQGIAFIDALFVSSSAFSDTGLSTLAIEQVFNWFGQFVTLILLNIGGVGWFTIKIFILTFILRKATKYNDINDGASELGTKTKHDTLGLVFTAIVISTFSTFFFGMVFGILFATVTPNSSFNGADAAGEIMNWGDAIWTGIFHASASVNNSGFDIFPGNTSLSAYAGNIFIQLLTIFLFILGGIGFGIFYDVYQWIICKKTGRVFSFSLITKLSVTVYFSVAIVGLILVYSVEGISAINNSDAFLAPGDNLGMRIWAITFNTFSTRNAGFSTMDLSKLQDLTMVIQSIMMFIGSGPGSTAGGLRTTTFGVLLVSVWAFTRNKKNPTVFGRSIPEEITKDAIKIFFVSIALIFFAIFFISLSENLNNNEPGKENILFINNMFLVFSAYGTTGLAANDISNYSVVSKFILILMMFIGQMGMSTTLSQAKTKQIKHQKQFIEEYVNLG